MNFAEQPPSKQWASLKYRGETIAEVWFKPEGQPFALTFRIPRKTFDLPDVGPRLTAENLLKAVAVAAAEVESWRHGDVSHPGTPELGDPLPPPPPDVPHLVVSVTLKAPSRDAAPDEGPAPEVLPTQFWQDLEARWTAIQALEGTIDSLRLRAEALMAEMETASKRTLTGDEKVNALNADVAQWGKAKSRVHFTVPKAKEFIHRATWAAGTPERKRLDDIVKDHIQPRVPFPELGKVPEQLENLLKDRQVLSAQGTAVCQECQAVVAEVQGALRTLQSNAAANAQKKRGATAARGKFF